MAINQYKGQTLLITIFVLTIAITVALSFVKRTTVDVATSSQLEESARAFSAAEAGIEDVLKRLEGNTMTIQSGNFSAQFDTTHTSFAGSSDTYTYPTETVRGDVATVWLVNHNADGELDDTGEDHYCKNSVNKCYIKICWEQPSTPADIPAVDIGVLYRVTQGGDYAIQRFAYDPDPVRVGNKFERLTGGPGTDCGTTGVYTVTIDLSTSNYRALALRLRPYYNKTTFIITPDTEQHDRVLPPQGFEVTSTGKTGSGVSRKIVVRRFYDAPHTLFDYVLYSNTTITKVAY